MAKDAKHKLTNPVGLILLSAASITLYFNSGLEDPFNSPKLWLLIVFGSWIAGLLITAKKSEFSKNKTLLSVILSSFIGSLAIATIFTDMKYTALFGEVQRRTGLITYIFFAVYLYASAKFFTYRSISLLLIVNTILATVFVLYGLIQNSGNDFIEWNNPYNSIILTLGNPNFASALMAISAVLCLTTIFNKQLSVYLKAFNLVLVGFLLFQIYLSNSRQGIVAFLIALALLVTIIGFNQNRVMGFITLGVSSIVGVLAILGMLQIGLLKDYLYKDSVSVRGFYWRAALEMFLDKPLTGVGVDRYGSFFKEFREVEYPLRYGFDITSSNAHSVPIQMFATGGLFVGVAYLLVAGLIFYRGIVSLRVYSGSEKLTVAGVFAAWIAFQAQSVISIDNIGLTVWGWILGGAIIGLSSFDGAQEIQQGKVKIGTNQFRFSLAQPLVSGFLTLTAILLVSILYRGESITMEAKKYYNNNNVIQPQQFYDLTNEAFTTTLIEPYYKLRLVDLLATTQAIDPARVEIEKLYQLDPRNLDVLKVYASILEFQKSFDQAITLRKQIIKYDPWNALNYLDLGRNYKSIGDWANMESMRLKVISFAPQTSEAKLASIELVKQ
jgi:hypothetical protein